MKREPKCNFHPASPSCESPLKVWENNTFLPFDVCYNISMGTVSSAEWLPELRKQKAENV